MKVEPDSILRLCPYARRRYSNASIKCDRTSEDCVLQKEGKGCSFWDTLKPEQPQILSSTGRFLGKMTFGVIR